MASTEDKEMESKQEVESGAEEGASEAPAKEDEGREITAWCILLRCLCFSFNAIEKVLVVSFPAVIVNIIHLYECYLKCFLIYIIIIHCVPKNVTTLSCCKSDIY